MTKRKSAARRVAACGRQEVRHGVALIVLIVARSGRKGKLIMKKVVELVVGVAVMFGGLWLFCLLAHLALKVAGVS